MGAFIIVLLLSRVARRWTGYDARGSLLALGITAVVSIGLGSIGYAEGPLTPAQVLPFVALGYGKFCLALLIVDLDTAKRLKANPAYLKDRPRFGFAPTLAWIPAVAVVALGAAASLALPQPGLPAGSAGPVEWQSLESADGRFFASLPGRPAETSASQPNPTGRLPTVVHSYQLERPDGYYTIQWMRFEDAHIDPSATVERVLESTRDGMITNTAGQLLDGGFVEHGGWPALDATIRVIDAADTVVGRSRIVLAGRTLYTLLAFGAADDLAQKFFDSFQVLEAYDSFRLPRRAGRP